MVGLFDGEMWQVVERWEEVERHSREKMEKDWKKVLTQALKWVLFFPSYYLSEKYEQLMTVKYRLELA